MIVLGITGAFGCGKSAVLRFFASRNWFVFDADTVCKSLYTRGNPAILKAVRELFGADVFHSDGTVNLARLGHEAFRQPEKMPRLTAELYPALTEIMRANIEDCRKCGRNGAFEVPLLYEAGFAEFFDAVLAVWAPETLRRLRLRGRGFDDAAFERRSRMQLSADDKLARADFAVINTGGLNDLDAQLLKLCENF